MKVSQKSIWATVGLDASIAGKGEVLYYGDVVLDVSVGSGEERSLGNR